MALIKLNTGEEIKVRKNREETIYQLQKDTEAGLFYSTPFEQLIGASPEQINIRVDEVVWVKEG